MNITVGSKIEKLCSPNTVLGMARICIVEVMFKDIKWNDETPIKIHFRMFYVFRFNSFNIYQILRLLLSTQNLGEF